MTNDLAEFQKEIVAHLTDPLVAIAAPREHAKSTLIDIIVTLWELYTQKFHYQIFIGDNSTTAEANLAAVIYEIENNALLIEDYGSLKPNVDEWTSRGKWTEKTIITTTNIKIQAVGVGAKIRGRKHLQWRPDRIVMDDIENDENVATKEQRDKLMKWILGAVIPARDRYEGKVRIIGTILHYDSALSNLISKDKNKRFTKLKFQAIGYGQDGQPKPLWPARWDLAALAIRKAEIGSVLFNQEFQNEAITDEDAIVKRNWLRFHNGFTPDQAKEQTKIIRIDPSISEKATADKFALVVVGQDHLKKIRVLDRFSAVGLSFQAQVQTAFQYAAKWSAGDNSKVEIHVEENAYQAALKQEIQRLSQESGQYWTVKGVKTVTDKTLRLKGVSGMIEGGYVEFDRTHDDLIEEVCNFGKTRYDDLVDALIGALEGLRVMVPGMLGWMKEQAEKAGTNPVQSFIQQYGTQLRNQP